MKNFSQRSLIVERKGVHNGSRLIYGKFNVQSNEDHYGTIHWIVFNSVRYVKLAARKVIQVWNDSCPANVHNAHQQFNKTVWCSCDLDDKRHWSKQTLGCIQFIQRIHWLCSSGTSLQGHETHWNGTAMVYLNGECIALTHHEAHSNGTLEATLRGIHCILLSGFTLYTKLNKTILSSLSKDNSLFSLLSEEGKWNVEKCLAFYSI